MSHQRRRCTGLCWAGSSMTLMGVDSMCPGWVWFILSNCDFSNITVNHRINANRGLCLCKSILVSLFHPFAFFNPFYTHVLPLILSIHVFSWWSVCVCPCWHETSWWVMWIRSCWCVTTPSAKTCWSRHWSITWCPSRGVFSVTAAPDRAAAREPVRCSLL